MQVLLVFASLDLPLHPLPPFDSRRGCHQPRKHLRILIVDLFEPNAAIERGISLEILAQRAGLRSSASGVGVVDLEYAFDHALVIAVDLPLVAIKGDMELGLQGAVGVDPGLGGHDAHEVSALSFGLLHYLQPGLAVSQVPKVHRI